MMTKTLVIFAIFLASTATGAQETYKCKTAGGMVYQDRPCAGVRYAGDVPATMPSAKAPEARPAATVAPAAGDLDRNKAYLAGREKERKVADLKEQIARQEESITQSQQARDAEIAGLQARQARANNNLAGANLEQALATEMQSVNARYATDINLKQDRLKQLRDELSQASK